MSTDAIQINPTVFVVDDDPDVRDSLCWLIEPEGWSVEAFEDAAGVLERVDRGTAGCLVADLRLPGMSGLDLYDELQERGIDLPTIIITGHGDVPAAVRALKGGCLDFIEKPFVDQALLGRIREAMDHDRAQRAERERLGETQRKLGKLTSREQEVLAHVVTGKLNKQIAAALGLSHKTIEVHRAHVMEKMEAKSLADLVRMASSAGY